MPSGMKTGGVLSTLALLTLCLASPAAADDHENPWYLRSGMGLIVLQDNEIDNTNVDIDYDPGFSINTALGYRFTEMFRAEGEFGANFAEVDSPSALDAEFHELRFLVSGIVEVPDLEVADTRVAPFAGLGIGLASSKIDGSDREAAFTLQVELGIEAKVTDRLWIGPNYRFQYGTYDGDGDLDDRTFGHVINFLGVRYEL